MQYKLPIAGANTLGGVKIGDTMTIDSDGVMNVKGLDELQTVYEESIASVSAGKTLIAEAITGKGVQTEGSATFQTMADNISAIQSGGGTGCGLLKLIPMNYCGYVSDVAGAYEEVDNG